MAIVKHLSFCCGRYLLELFAEDILILSCVFCLIQRFIRAQEQILISGGGAGNNSDTDRRSKFACATRATNCFEQPCAAVCNLACVAYILHKDQEFFAADTAYNIITLDMENRGWARAYWPYDLKLRLKNEEGSYIIPLDADNREWLPDNPFTIDLRVDARGVPAGEYDVSIGLFEGERPIKLAIKETALDEGFYTIGRTAVRTV